MATNRRTFADGLNELNGFTINVIRFVGAQQVSESSRIAARYWGTITTPSGDVVNMGESGMTVMQIKKIVGGESRSYNRSGDSSELTKLESLKSQLESLGMSTTEVDLLISAKRTEIEAAKVADEFRKLNQKRIKDLNKELKKLSEIRTTMSAVGLDTTEICNKMNEIEQEIANLTI